MIYPANDLPKTAYLPNGREYDTVRFKKGLPLQEINPGILSPGFRQDAHMFARIKDGRNMPCAMTGVPARSFPPCT